MYSSTHTWKLLMWGAWPKYHESMANCSQCYQWLYIILHKMFFFTTVPGDEAMLVSNDHYCHPADGILNSNDFLSMLFVRISLQKWLGDKDIAIPCEIEIVYHRWQSAMPADTKFKTTKINSGAFSDFSQKLAPLKITHHNDTVWPL